MDRRQEADQRQNRSANKPFALVLIAVAAGVIVDRYVGMRFQLCWILSLVFVCIHLAAVRFVRSSSRPSFGFKTALLIVAWAFVGAAWHHFHFRIFQADDLGLYAKEDSVPVVLRAWIIEGPRQNPSAELSVMDLPICNSGERTRMVVLANTIRNGFSWEKISGRAQVTLRGITTNELRIGDEIELRGFLSLPPGQRSPGGFDLRDHWRAGRVLSHISVSHSENVVRTGKVRLANLPQRCLQSVASRCGEIIDDHFSAESAGLVRAMLLGEREGVSKSLQEKFLVTGTMHLLAISGLHVGILASCWLMMIRLGLLPRTFGYLWTIVFVIFYCMMVGARPPVFRATILVVLFCLARISGRQPISVNSLCLAGVSVVLLNPVSLFQPGPQLSFVAVAALIMVGDHSRQSKSKDDPLVLFLRRKRSAFQRRRDRVFTNAMTLCFGSTAVWIATLPLVTEYFHVVAPVGIVANVLVMIPVAFLLNLSFLTLIFGALGMGKPFAWIAELSIKLITELIHLGGEVPLGYWWSFGMGPFWLAGFYLVFAIFFLNARYRIPLRWQTTLAMIWLALSLAVTTSKKNHDRLVVTFIDVGHGSSVLLELPNGKAVLYDAGCLTSSQLASQRIAGVLWAKRIPRLDAIIVSHADLDHYNSIPQLVSKFTVDRVVMSAGMNSSSGNSGSGPSSSGPSSSGGRPIGYLFQQVDAFQVQKEFADATFKMQFDERCTTRILHPPPDFHGQSDNANSLVLLVKFQGVSILLTGDIERDGLDCLLETEPQQIDVMMVPHHGSLSVDHNAILEWATPTHAVISSAKQTIDSGVRRVYQSHGVKLYETSRHGTISFELRASGIELNKYCN